MSKIYTFDYQDLDELWSDESYKECKTKEEWYENTTQGRYQQLCKLQEDDPIGVNPDIIRESDYDRFRIFRDGSCDDDDWPILTKEFVSYNNGKNKSLTEFRNGQKIDTELGWKSDETILYAAFWGSEPHRLRSVRDFTRITTVTYTQDGREEKIEMK